MHAVILRRNWPGTFRRTVRDKSGAIRTLSFTPNAQVDLTPEDFELIRPDLGKAIVPAKDGKPLEDEAIPQPVAEEEAKPRRRR